jgi:hypothetical protein
MNSSLSFVNDLLQIREKSFDPKSDIKAEQFNKTYFA